MAIPAQTNLVKTPMRVNDLPRTIPLMPDEVVQRFPQLVSWHERFTKWWFDARTILQDSSLRDLLDDTVESLSSFQSTTDSSISSINSSIASLLSDVADLKAELNGLGIDSINTSIQNILITIAQLQADFTSIFNQVQNIQTQINDLVDGLGPYLHIQGTPLNPWTVNHGRTVRPGGLRIMSTPDYDAIMGGYRTDDSTLGTTIITFGYNFGPGIAVFTFS